MRRHLAVLAVAVAVLGVPSTALANGDALEEAMHAEVMAP